MDPLFEAEVRDLNSDGQGVVTHPDGRVFFVEGTWPGDRGRFEITLLKRRYGWARLVELLERSPARRAAPCPHQGYQPGLCGGCPWMIADYEAQLEQKFLRVKKEFTRAKLLSNAEELKPIWASPAEFHYRNRAQFKTDGKSLGYVSRNLRSLAPIESCLILNEKMSALFQALKKLLPRADWSPAPPHPWNFIDADDEMPPGEWTLNRRRPFRQGNTAQNERLKTWVKERALPRKNVLELYAGSGNLTRLLTAEKILALEVSQEAVEKLRALLPAVEARTFDLRQPRDFERLAKESFAPEVLLLDPPRQGAPGLERLTAQRPELEQILYVSCDLATLIRDLRAVRPTGFAVTEVQPLDLFPQTPHVEILVELKRIPG